MVTLSWLHNLTQTQRRKGVLVEGPPQNLQKALRGIYDRLPDLTRNKEEGIPGVAKGILLDNHTWGTRKIPLGAKALGNGIGEVQGVLENWQGPRVLFLAVPGLGALLSTICWS